MNCIPEIEGFCLVNKPKNWTSFDVVKKIKFGTKIKKIGHAGTLDPLATGLLIICYGKFTKKIEHFQGLSKTYKGTFVLGKTTPSIDLETEFDAEFQINHITEAQIEQCRLMFLGEILQTPPLFSAVQVGGERLYQKARRGEKFDEIPARKVKIESILLDSSLFPEIKFEIVCSKGTYIRSWVRDFGQALHSGAYMSALERTKIGEYSIENSKTMEEIVPFLNLLKPAIL